VYYIPAGLCTSTGINICPRVGGVSRNTRAEALLTHTLEVVGHIFLDPPSEDYDGEKKKSKYFGVFSLELILFIFTINLQDLLPENIVQIALASTRDAFYDSVGVGIVCQNLHDTIRHELAELSHLSAHWWEPEDDSDD